MNMNDLIPMSPSILFVAGLALSCAMLSGLFFVFSNFAMKAFSTIPTNAGVSAMQSINATILNPGFFGLFIGTATGSLTVLVVALRHWGHPASFWVAAGALLCLGGCYLVTAGINVPLNRQLDQVDPANLRRQLKRGRITSPAGNRGTTSAPSPPSCRQSASPSAR